MKYLLASDYDGTLLRHKQLSEEDHDAIVEWQRQGHIFCLCSGRAPQAAVNEMKKWDLCPHLLITGNGSSAMDMDGKFLFRHPFPSEHLHRLLERVHQLDCVSFHLHGKDGELRIWSSLQPERTNITREQAEAVKELSQFGTNFNGRVEVAAAFADWVEKTFCDVTAHPNGGYVDCTIRGVDKATGVAEAAKRFHVDLENCYTIGDNINDLPMLLPYHGAAIETGDAETIKKVGRSVPSVAAFIQEILKQ